MMRIEKVSLLLAALLLASAAKADMAAEGFASVYTSTCMKYLGQYETLSQKLELAPQLDREKGKPFFMDERAQAWPVPDKRGMYVMALSGNKQVCTVFVRRANAQAMRDDFIRLVSQAPAPMSATRIKDEKTNSEKNGELQTISYEWGAPVQNRKVHFLLTTATAETADLQGMISVSVVDFREATEVPKPKSGTKSEVLRPREPQVNPAPNADALR